MSDYVNITCCRCGERFGLARDSHAHLKRSSQTFWCPNGHQQHFPLGPTEAEKLQQDRASHHKARAAAYKGQVTKIKRRVGAGICPCCNRSFANLARHMAGQHPDFTPDQESETADG